jgi:palmitoyltransferase
MEPQGLNAKKLFGNFFVLFVAFVIGQIYYVTVVLTFLPLAACKLKPAPSIIVFLVIFHLELLLLLWCFVKAMIIDPGRVPRYWGFYMGDSEMKRRRYCLMCHVFKPERCHHCSSCNRCVLNMDHHCPWINNCVGFYNRKFFMLLLFYVILITYTVDVALFTTAQSTVLELFSLGTLQIWPNAFFLSSYSLNVSLSVVMTLFFRFHLKLLFSNKTTIDTMDKKNLNQRGDVISKQFNISPKFNFIQVFGRNPWLWLVPITGYSGKPVGDGVTWRTAVNSFIDEEAPNESDGRKKGPIAQSVNSIASPKSGVHSALASPTLERPAIQPRRDPVVRKEPVA